MKKVSLFYGFIFLLLGTIGQETFAMKGFGQKASNYFRLGMKSLNHATLMALPMYLGYKKFQNPPSPLKDPEATTVEPEIEKFVLNTCFEAYPELKNRTIKVLQSPNSTFAAGVSTDGSYITVPKHLKNNELEDAIILKEKKFYRSSYTDSEELAKKNDCSVYELLSLQKVHGIAADPYTLDTWRGIILHEGSHLLHYDNMKHNTIALVAPAIVLYSTGKLKQFLGLNIVFPNNPILGNILRGLGYIPSFPLKIIANACLLMGPIKY